MRLLIASSDTFSPTRVDVSIMFGEELAGRGHRIDWILPSAASCARRGMLRIGAVAGLCIAFRKVSNLPPALEMICGAFICSIVVLIHLRSPAITLSDRLILRNVLHGREGKVLRWIGLLRYDDDK